MAIWQFGMALIPEKVLLDEYDVLPLQIPQGLAEEAQWWSNVQPTVGFEKQIDLILPERKSWSTSMRMWGQKGGNDAYVCYVDESLNTVEEIVFRIDAGAISLELLRKICILARQLGCMLMTANDEILAPDESMVLSALNQSTAKRYVEDPVSTLRDLGRPEIQARFKRHEK